MVRVDRRVERDPIAGMKPLTLEDACTRDKLWRKVRIRKPDPQGRRATYGIVRRGPDGHRGYSSAPSGDDPTA